MSDTDQAIEEGKLAAANGEPRSANPYDAATQTDLHEAWNEGYDYASSRDDDDEPRDE